MPYHQPSGGVAQMQRAGWMDLPRSGERIRERQSDVRALVVREVEVVATERVVHPLGNAQERRPVDVGSDAGVESRMDDRALAESWYGDAHVREYARRRSIRHPVGSHVRIPRSEQEPL